MLLSRFLAGLFLRLLSKCGMKLSLVLRPVQLVLILFAFVLALIEAPAQNQPEASWTVTGSMATDRYAHTATLLPSGKVLVAGGYSLHVGALRSAELYDPATGTWTATGDMTIERWYHTSTLLPSGKVLVAAGGDANFNALSSAELYDPATGIWTRTGRLASARSGHTATLLPSGKVLVAAGGDNGEFTQRRALRSGCGHVDDDW